MSTATLSKLSAIAVGASVLALGAINPAQAAQFNFSYTALGQENVNFSGLITADDLGGGQFSITALTGQRNGVSVASLLPINAFASNDNLFFPSQSVPVTFRGFSYELVGGLRINFAAPGNGTFGESFNGFTIANTVTSFSATPVPTPALLPGLIGMGVAALRKKRKEEAAAPIEA